ALVACGQSSSRRTKCVLALVSTAIVPTLTASGPTGAPPLILSVSELAPAGAAAGAAGAGACAAGGAAGVSALLGASCLHATNASEAHTTVHLVFIDDL